jgi:aromatic-L-amino-acid/L-tryptophan decarboxylase
VIDWIADYQRRVASLDVQSRLEPGAVRRRLPPQPPESGEPFDRVLADIDDVLLPGITHWQSPSFFGFFPANVSGPSILGELLAAGLGVQGMLWSTSPSCTELECHVLDWIVELLDLPAAFRSETAGGGVIQDSASSATLCALVAARERARRSDPSARPLVAYASEQAHSSVTKGARIAAYDVVRLIEVDGTYALGPDALRAAIEHDLGTGLLPTLVCATVGTTSSNAFDPLEPIGELCKQHRIWFHVDAAMCGTAALCPEHRWIHLGLERADSYVFNPHKWMLTNFDCSCFFLADRSALLEALSITPEYLDDPARRSGSVGDYRDWQIPLGRRFRALKLWLVIRHYGADGLRQHVRHHVALARSFARWVDDHPRLELAAPARLTLVCFRHIDGDDATNAMLDDINAGGRAFLTRTTLSGSSVARVAIGGTRTEARHMDTLQQLIDDAARRR